MKKIIFVLVISMISVNSFAESKGTNGENMVSWEGYIVADGGHTNRHDHSIEFIRKSDGETFDVRKSPDLEKIHCETSKKLLVKINAEKTSRFLFWGGNLIVKNFEVLEEMDLVAHRIYVPPRGKGVATER